MATSPIKAKGICSGCGKPRQIRTDGMIGRHRKGGGSSTGVNPDLSRAYLTPQCSGAGEKPAYLLEER